MRFREHRGSYHDSLATTVELSDREALIAHLNHVLFPFFFEVHDRDVKVEPYHHDNREGWRAPTYIVILRGYGVIGFTDRYV